MKYIYGPVPSRRLGRSLGIDPIPSKTCNYQCIYCQLGKTSKMKIQPQVFYLPSEIFREVQDKVKKSKEKGEPIDYLTFVSDGEPTLDINLGKEIELLKPLRIKTAIITNSSLIWKKDVIDDISKADWICVKIDAISQNIWKKINRPYKFLKLKKILDGIIEFSHFFKGDLVSETMLIQNINDKDFEMEKIADFISSLNIKKSYISIPIRPPAEKWVKSADEHSVTKAYQIFKEKNIDVEYLIVYEGNAFAYTGDVEDDLLSIISVHPMKEEALIEFLKKAGKDWSSIKKLLNDGKLKEVEYNNKKFYVRKFS